ASPRRSRGALAALARFSLRSDLEALPPDSLHAHSRGPLPPRAVRVARSRLSRASHCVLIWRLRPPDSLHAHSRGPLPPRAVRVARSRLSRASHCVLIWRLRPQTPCTLTRGAPCLPAPFAWRARGSRALLIAF